MAILQSTGKITFLRANELGDRFGPGGDQIEAEVITRLDSQPDKAFGFKLRDDQNQPANRGMFDLLRDAFNHDWTVTLNYDIEEGKDQGIIIRTWLEK